MVEQKAETQPAGRSYTRQSVLRLAQIREEISTLVDSHDMLLGVGGPEAVSAMLDDALHLLASEMKRERA